MRYLTCPQHDLFEKKLDLKVKHIFYLHKKMVKSYYNMIRCTQLPALWSKQIYANLLQTSTQYFKI